MENQKKQVLFICTKNACRSQMAEALVNHHLGDDFTAFSAGTAPTRPNPLGIKVLAEVGIDHSNAVSNEIADFNHLDFDHIITLCDNADKQCPASFGGINRIHIGFENPDLAKGTEQERLVVFRRVRDDIHKRIFEYLKNPKKPNEKLNLVMPE